MSSFNSVLTSPLSMLLHRLQPVRILPNFRSFGSDALNLLNTEKDAAKRRRTEFYKSSVARRASLPDRRDLRKRDFSKRQFREWFDPISRRHEFLEREARRSGLPLRIRVVATLERLPIVTPDIPKWEKEYYALRAELDRYRACYPKELGMGDPMDEKVLSEEELYALLPEGYTPSPRITDADKSGDVRTLNRRLDTRTYLAIRDNDNSGWCLPSVLLETGKGDGGDKKEEVGGETILEGAKRAVSSVAGTRLKLLCLSNCPAAAEIIPYDEQKRDEVKAFGEKLFYMKVQYESGDIVEERMGRTTQDWGWLTRQEMTERVTEETSTEKGLFYHYFL